MIARHRTINTITVIGGRRAHIQSIGKRTAFRELKDTRARAIGARRDNLVAIGHYPTLWHLPTTFLCEVVFKDDIGIGRIRWSNGLIGLLLKGDIVFDLLSGWLIDNLIKAEIRTADVVDRQRVGTFVELEAEAHRAPIVVAGDRAAHFLLRAVHIQFQVTLLVGVHIAQSHTIVTADIGIEHVTQTAILAGSHDDVAIARIAALVGMNIVGTQAALLNRAIVNVLSLDGDGTGVCLRLLGTLQGSIGKIVGAASGSVALTTQLDVDRATVRDEQRVCTRCGIPSV